ncbi:Rrf2 family transcriptional regulator [Mesorhizobium sp. CAU 1732]|uniref:RrF2 family transcriptional regulator n=1 Tax=Mesorhizobium sp. CAU 1732 TaxID=3140358 RepID=UPI0032604967
MKRDTRLSGMLHLLLHMADAKTPSTSEELARYMDTNAVVVRRTMAGLREAGIVVSEKGHGGGWRLARDLADITLAQVHAAIGRPSLFAFGNRNDQPECLVEQAVNTALDDTLAQAEALISARLAGITLKDIAEDFRQRMAERGCAATGERHV